jgi:hypothetical protein
MGRRMSEAERAGGPNVGGEFDDQRPAGGSQPLDAPVRVLGIPASKRAHPSGQTR